MPYHSGKHDEENCSNLLHLTHICFGIILLDINPKTIQKSKTKREKKEEEKVLVVLSVIAKNKGEKKKERESSLCS